MLRELSSGVLTAMVIGVVLFHIVLLVSAFLYRRKVNPLYLLAGAFIILSPISGATELPGTVLAKWARLYVAVMIVIIGVFGYRILRVGLASTVLLIFACYYVIAAVWSDMPIIGLMWKSMLIVSVLAGMFLAYSVRDRDELARGIRFIGIIAGFAGLLTVSGVLFHPEAVLMQGRLGLWGMNPNRIGLTAAPLLILCGYLALYDRSKIWKSLGYVVGITLALVILYTGSRAAAGTAVIGCFIVALPLIKKPIQATFVAVVVMLCAWLAVEYIQTEGTLRLFDVSATQNIVEEASKSRGYRWNEAITIFRKSPLFGQGWVYTTQHHGIPGTQNLHNMYLQVMAESGLLGLSLLAISLSFSIVRGTRMFLSARRHANIASLAALPLGLLVAHAFHGIAESAILMGGTLGSLFLGYSIGLIDYLPKLARSEISRALPTVSYTAAMRRPRWGRGAAGSEIAP